jgi:predicted RND superfamily exporter protein
MNWLSRLVLRRAGWIALVGTLLAGSGAYYSVQLYKNLRTDLQELLPTDSRSVVDLNEVSRRLLAIDNLAVLVLSDRPEASKRFVDDLAASLKDAPRDVISSVEYRIDRELQFFKERRALYMDLDDLKRVRAYIADRIEYEKALYNPLNIFSEVEIPEPKLDFLGMQRKYEGRTSAYSRFPSGYYATPDQKKRVVLVYMPSGGSGGSVYKLKHYVQDAIERLNPASYDAGMRILYTGGVQNTIEEQDALVADLELSTILTVVVVGLAMVYFFRAWRATAALMAALFVGTLWTFGIAYFAVGYLNANSAFLGSIVIGNGINFPIIFLARYLEERRNRKRNERAISLSIRHTATATSTAALAAGLSYGSLMLTGFRGFKQFGVIGLIGMVLCWISAFTMLPAYLTLFDRLRSLVPRNRGKPKSHLAEWTARLVQRVPGPLWTLSFVLTLASVATFTRYTPDIIESDISKLRNKESMERGSGFLSKHVDEIFQRYLSPMVILPHTREEADAIARRLKAQKDKEGKSSLIASVQTLDDFIPADQPEKIRLLREIQRLLPPRIMKRLSPEDRRTVEEFLTPEAMRPLRQSDLPKLVLDKFREKDGSIGKLVLVEPPITNETFNRANLHRFIHELREAADAVAPGAPVAGSLAISSDMIESIAHDGPRATLFAFLAVILLVAFIFHNFRTVGLVLFALVLGVVWLAGIILGFGIKVNFLNFIALPITFGIGVDYGVNIFQRYREEGAGSILKVIRDTGGAVLLCSFTTIVGYASLLIAQNQAFVSFGMLAVLGEVTCLLAAIVSLPAFLLLQSRRRARRAAAETP